MSRIRGFKTGTSTFLLVIISIVSNAQNNTFFTDNSKYRAITTAVPFLMISPDARSGALGDAGAAMPDDLNALHWNVAKLPFNEKNGAVSISYTPWLRALVPDVSLSYLSIYGKINDRSAVAASLRYFSMGEIQFTDNVGNPLGNYTPNEFAGDFGYAQKLSDKFSVGVAFRFIYSNLAGGFNQSSNPINPGKSYAGDITCYYKNDTRYKGYKINYGWGVAATNIGSKMTYTSDNYANFIPINLRVGGYGQFEIDKWNTVALMIDLNKLMVPSPPIYQRDSAGNIMVDPNNNPKIQSGMNPRVPIVQGMMQSFYDAPNGFVEELTEINISTGIEYWYDKQFALRTGYFYENPTKGNRQYMTFGIGLRYNVFGLDAAYLVSFGQRNPLDNTLRFSLTFDFDAFKMQNKSDEKRDAFDVPSN